MKRNLNLIAALVLFALCAGSVQAATLYWDRNGSTAGASSSPNGQWSTTSGQFNTTAAGTGASGADILSWSPTTGSADTAYFAAGSDAVSAYNVTVNGAVSVAGITFGYGGPATLLDAGGSISLDAVAVSVVNTVNGTINTLLQGTGTLTKSGAGTLTLANAANTYSGNLTIANGGLTISTINNVSANGNLGNNANAVTLGGSGTTGRLTITGAGLSSSKPFAMAASGTGVINPQANTLTLTGALSGSGNFTKEGTGTLILGTTDSSGLTGATAINAGTIDVTTGGSLGSSAVTVGGSGTLRIVYSGSDAFWTNSALTYSAGTSIQNIDFGANAPSTTVAPIRVAGALTFTGVPAINIAGSALANGSYPLIRYGSGASASYPMAVASVPSPFVATITNDTGNLTLRLSLVTPAGSIHWASGNGVWEIGGSTPWSGAVSFADDDVVEFLDLDATGNPTVTLNSTVQPLSMLVSNNSAAYTITGSGAIAGATALIKKDPGTLTLDVANTYTGGTVLNAGTLNIADAAALGGSASTFTIAGGTIDNTSGGALTTTSYPQNWNGDFTFTGTDDLNLGTGAVTPNASRTVTVTAKKLTIGGAISGSGLALTKAGSGTLQLGGANTFSGDTRIGAGVLTLGNSSALQNSILDLNLADSGTLAFTSSLGTAAFPNLKAAGAASARTLSLQDESATAVAVTIGSDNTTQTFNGSLSGAGSLIKTGTGTNVVESASQTWTHTGGTTIGASGTVQMGVSLNTGSGGMTVNGLWANQGRTITMNGLSGTGTLTTQGTFDNNDWIIGNGDANSSFSGQILKNNAKNNSLKKVGTGTLTLSGSSSIGTVNGVRIEAGRIVAKHTGALGSFSCTVGGAGSAAALEMNTGTGATWDGTMSLVLSNQATLTLAGTSTITYSKSSNPAIDGAAGAATATISTAASTDYLKITTAITGQNGAGTLNFGGPGRIHLTGTGALVSGTIVNLNCGTLVWGSANPFGTTITLNIDGGKLANDAGTGRTMPSTVTLNVNADFTVDDSVFTTGVNGQILFSAGPVTLKNGNRTITVDSPNGQSANLSFTGVVGEDVAGRGLIKAGSGILVLNNAANTYSGDTTVSGGELRVDADGSLGTGVGTFHLSGGKLTTSASRTATIPNPLDLTASTEITTSSTSDPANLDFTTSTVTTTAGTLTFRNDSGSGTGVFRPRFSGSGFTFSRPIVINNGSFGTTELNSYNTTGTDQQFDGEISGSGSYKRNASTVGTGGRTIFTAANSYAGGTLVSRGTLAVNNTTGSGTGTGAVDVSSDGTLSGTGSISGSVTNSGTLSPGSSIGELDTGTETWNSLGEYDWEVDNVTGTPGTDWDHLNVTGDIDVQATSGSKFTVNVQPTGGTITGIDKDVSTTWIIATASGSVLNFAADKFTVTDTATDDLGGGEFVVREGSMAIAFTNNHAPVAIATNYTRAKNTSLKIPLPNLVSARTSDQDGHSRFLHHLVSTAGLNMSTNGHTVTTNGNYIFYPNATNNVADEISYVVLDNAPYRAGDTRRYATNTITITTVDSIGSVTITNDPAVGITLSFYGIPGYGYVIQEGDVADFTGSINEILTTNAPAGGLFEWVVVTPGFNPAFYRIRSE